MVKEYISSKATGRQGVLTSELEKALADWVLRACLQGFFLTKAQILMCARLVARGAAERFRSKDGLPGDKWFYRWFHAHMEVSKRGMDTLCRLRQGAANTYTQSPHHDDALDDVRQVLQGAGGVGSGAS